jgi:hypothetical protein
LDHSCTFSLHVIIHSVTSSYTVTHDTQCHIIIHSVTSSYTVSHHHTQCHIIIHSVTSSYTNLTSSQPTLSFERANHHTSPPSPPPLPCHLLPPAGHATAFEFPWPPPYAKENANLVEKASFRLGPILLPPPPSPRPPLPPPHQLQPPDGPLRGLGHKPGRHNLCGREHYFRSSCS